MYQGATLSTVPADAGRLPLPPPTWPGRRSWSGQLLNSRRRCPGLSEVGPPAALPQRRTDSIAPSRYTRTNIGQLDAISGSEQLITSRREQWTN
jgi:hypothetical protein